LVFFTLKSLYAKTALKVTSLSLSESFFHGGIERLAGDGDKSIDSKKARSSLLFHDADIHITILPKAKKMTFYVQ
jgi:hypothetical protein